MATSPPCSTCRAIPTKRSCVEARDRASHPPRMDRRRPRALRRIRRPIPTSAASTRRCCPASNPMRRSTASPPTCNATAMACSPSSARSTVLCSAMSASFRSTCRSAAIRRSRSAGCSASSIGAMATRPKRHGPGSTTPSRRSDCPEIVAWTSVPNLPASASCRSSACRTIPRTTSCTPGCRRAIRSGRTCSIGSAA